MCYSNFRHRNGGLVLIAGPRARVGGRKRMFVQTRRILSNRKALQPIHRVLRPAYYKYVKKRPLINYDRLEVIQHSTYQNIYYCCTQRTGSQWFKRSCAIPSSTGIRV
jgi:hypothetical protein